MISPKCKTQQARPYLSAEGIYLPCCWIGTWPTIKALQEFLGEDFELLSIARYTPDQIEKSRAWEKLAASWNSGQPFQGCGEFCGGKYEQSSKNSTSRFEYL